MDRTEGTHTAEVEVLGERFLFTDDPVNVQALLSTQFNDFGINLVIRTVINQLTKPLGKGEPFYRDWFDFLGDSIFTTDSKQWHASRVLLRPLFLKTKLTELDIFESHVRKLINLLPRTSETVDVCDLFFRYTMDVSTEFLFGRSTDSLENSRNTFARAFADAQRFQNIVMRSG